MIATLSASLAAIAWQQSLDNHRKESLAELYRFRKGLDSLLDRHKYLPGLLAQHSLLSNALANESGLNPQQQANQFLEEVRHVTESDTIYLMNKAGTTISSSDWRSNNSFVGRNFSFRPYFTQAIKNGNGQYFALGTTSLKRGYYFSRAIYQGADAIGVVVVKVDLS